MKSSTKTISLLFIVAGLAACSSGTPTSSSYASSSELLSSSEPSSSSSQEDRIKPIEFTVVDLTQVHYMGNDEETFEDPHPIEYYYKTDKLQMYYLDEINDVYFVDMENYVKAFKDDIKEGYISTVEDNGVLSSWTVKKGDELVFRLAMDAEKQTMSIDGELDSVFLKSIPTGKTGEEDLAEITIDYLKGYENTTRVYDFAPYEFDYFKVDGKYNYPFALLNLGLCQVAERYFIYNSYEKQIFKYGNEDQFANTTFALENGQTIDAKLYILAGYQKQFNNGIDDVIEKMPKALAVFNKKLTYFIFDKFYGLAKQKEVKSMSAYFDNYEREKYYDSEENGKRFPAFAHAITLLNDLHTSYQPSSYFTYNTPDPFDYQQTLSKTRFDLRAYLNTERDDALRAYNEEHGTKLGNKAMKYSSDGVYGYFSFDTFDTYHYFDEGEVPAQELLGDTFYVFIRNLTEAKEKGVKRIVIDDSTNLGGYVTIMAKILALLSKDNKSVTYLKSDDNNAIMRTTIRLDINKDGKYDQEDCFGDDFEFFILTSNFSFSCGNAFPFYAKHDGLAKIVGATSGGGECCVFEYCFPSGESLKYSSPYHVGYYDEKTDTYVGNEDGALVNFDVANDNFNQIYDVDAMAQYLNKQAPMQAK